MKKFSLILLALIIIIACSDKKEETEEAIYTQSTYIVKKNEFLETIMVKLVSSIQLSRSVLNVLQDGGFPFRRCYPGDSINIVKKNNKFLELTYFQDQRNIYYVYNINDLLVMAMKYPYIDTTICLVKGKIKSTLYESILEIGETPNLVFRFADVLAWEVDFVTETREDDSFFIFIKKTFCDSVFLDYEDLIYIRYVGDIGDYYGIYYMDPEGHEDYYNRKGESLRKSLLKSPLKYSYISSYFSKRRFHPILKVWRPHHGLDYAAPIGTPVSAIGDGVVTFKGWRGGYGNLVDL